MTAPPSIGPKYRSKVAFFSAIACRGTARRCQSNRKVQTVEGSLLRLTLGQILTNGYLHQRQKAISTKFNLAIVRKMFVIAIKGRWESRPSSLAGTVSDLAGIPGTVFLSLSMYTYCCLCILIVVYVFLDEATLTEVFPCFFLGCKVNTRV